LTLSSFGIGTYKGEVSDRADEAWATSINCGLRNGINVLDTAIRYRAMRSERIIGRVLKELIERGELRRDEIFVSSKGGLISILEPWERERYVEEKIIQARGFSSNRIYKNMHCLDADFLAQEIELSLENLGLQSLDCYFLHNPELNLALLGQEEFYINLYRVFEMLETQAADGKIISFGIASWNGFRRRQGDSWYIDIEKVTTIAHEVAGDRHCFKYLELPLSIGMPFIYNNRITVPGGGQMSFLERTQALGLDIFTSASLYEGKLQELFNLQRMMDMVGLRDSEHNEDSVQVSLPLSENSIVQLFELLVAARSREHTLEMELKRASGNCLSPYPAALNLVRSLPEVTCALAGLENINYLEESLQLMKMPKIDPSLLRRFFSDLSLSW
jgi:aryl-alcohol dehydrogenase-like predicted oxidoreductase